VPAGAGTARPLTHDNISYAGVRFLPDGKELLAAGIEPGHGGRDYLIDLTNGNSRPITPEGVTGVTLSPDGRNIAVRGPDGKWNIWPLDGSGLRPVPDLDPKYGVTGWTPDSSSLYVSSGRASEKAAKIYRVNPATGKMEFWKEFGDALQIGASGVNPPRFSADGTAYAYGYEQVLSQAYVVKGVK
jgi:WD40 repeat protein